MSRGPSRRFAPLPLTLGAEMARAAADALHGDRGAADDAGLPCPVVDLVGELEVAGVAVRVAIDP